MTPPHNAKLFTTPKGREAYISRIEQGKYGYSALICYTDNGEFMTLAYEQIQKYL